MRCSDFSSAHVSSWKFAGALVAAIWDAPAARFLSSGGKIKLCDVCQRKIAFVETADARTIPIDLEQEVYALIRMKNEVLYVRTTLSWARHVCPKVRSQRCPPAFAGQR